MKNSKSSALDTLFRTPVDISAPLRKIGVGDSMLFLGSCFAEHMGGRFRDAHLRVLCNPLGTAYNPLSILRMLESVPISEEDLALGPMGYHSWITDTTFSSGAKDGTISKSNDAISQLQEAIVACDHAFITLGTSHIYRLRESGDVVTNCHKHSQNEFEEQNLTVDEVVEALDSIVKTLREHSPKVAITFTVSPYRYAKYGFHESQLSKATLLLAVDVLQRRYLDAVQYFPAYEMVLDELRDYRFYDTDMLHPSMQAVDYIGQRLQDWMGDDLKDYLKRWKPLAQAIKHRPLQTEGDAYHDFCRMTNEKIEQLQHDYPMLRIDERL